MTPADMSKTSELIAEAEAFPGAYDTMENAEWLIKRLATALSTPQGEVETKTKECERLEKMIVAGLPL